MKSLRHIYGCKHLMILLAVALLLTGSAYSARAQKEGSDQASDGPASGDQFTAPGENGAVLPEITVEAENKVQQEIQKGNYELELSAAIVDSFFTAMDEEALGVSPVSGLKPHLNNLEKLASDQPPHCWIREMSRDPVVTFFPEDQEGHKVHTWELNITDFRGSPFKNFTGKGTPPGQVQWDGCGDRGDMLKVGYPYSYVFSVTDKGTNTYNYAGVSFRIPALEYRQEGDRVLDLAGGELFQRDEAELTEGGRAWLTRSADEVRRHPYSPVMVVVIAETRSLAEQRAESVASFLATSMILPREQIETEAQQKPDLRAEMDGTVTITIEHAD